MTVFTRFDMLDGQTCDVCGAPAIQVLLNPLVTPPELSCWCDEHDRNRAVQVIAFLCDTLSGFGYDGPVYAGAQPGHPTGLPQP